MISQIFHSLTRNICIDFFRRSSPQQLLKIALPIIGLIALYKAREYFFKTRTVTDASNKPPAQQAVASTQEDLTFENQNLVDPVPPALYCGVKKFDDSLHLRSHRWSNPTNQNTLVKLSTGKAYPANILRFSESKTSYILAESPLNNKAVDWQIDYYRMALEKKAKVLISLECPFNKNSQKINTKQYHFVGPGETLKFDGWTVRCGTAKCIESQHQPINAYSLTCEHSDGRKKVLWQLLPCKAPIESFDALQCTINTLNLFIKDYGLRVDETHPLLLTCRTGIELSGPFVLFHELQANTEMLIKQSQDKTPEDIYQAIFGNQDISEMLMERAHFIEYSSTVSTAVVPPEKESHLVESIATEFKKDVQKTINATWVRTLSNP